ncbi:sulfatase-like hydrolase/transferase [Paenibacillus sp. 1P07SE]|uniref:sulfatase-like hydrolase/transferase n=1 Tax=Paenibacillus sp. 1P07SE TaxID=3132209 RepID=UPI0039A52EC9
MKKRSRPHIVLITLDECKASALGCYGNRDAYTPMMDKLASQGTLFREAYCTFPKCVPSRAALMTGRYPHVEGHRTLPGFEVRRGENHLVQELKRAGYKTAMFGKNHTIEPEWMEEMFDECRRARKGADVPWARRESEEDDDLFRAFYRGAFSDVHGMSDHHATQDALSFMERHRDSEDPFFLLVNYNAPHPPYTDIPPFIDLIRERKIALPRIEPLDEAPELLRAYREVYDLEHLSAAQWRQVVEAYYGLVAFVDDLVGQLVDGVEACGLAEDTVVVVTSDHGDFAGEHGCVEKWDTLFYDCMVKVPLIIRYPGHVRAGRTTEAMTDNVDVAPTLLELAGLEVPDWMQGRSLGDVLTGKTDTHKDAVFCEGGVEEAALSRTVGLDTEAHRQRHPNYHWKQELIVRHPWSIHRAKMIRTRDWKLVYRLSGVKELYNLREDPGEYCDVAALPEHREVIADLMERLLQWTIRTETDYPRIETMYS